MSRATSSSGKAIVVILLLSVAAAFYFFFFFLKSQVNKEFEASPPPGQDQSMAGYCDEFVTFTFTCGLARPEIDPAKELRPQHLRNRQVQERLAGNCREKRAPYNEALIQCYLEAGGFCSVYNECSINIGSK
jgi:hypothetical protein